MVKKIDVDLGNGWRAVRATIRDEAILPLYLVEIASPQGHIFTPRFDLGKRVFIDHLQVDMDGWNEKVADALSRA